MGVEAYDPGVTDCFDRLFFVGLPDAAKADHRR